MRLSHAGLQPAIQPDEIEKKLKETLIAKRWTKFTINVVLEYHPYYFFVFNEKHAAFNARTGKHAPVVGEELTEHHETAQYEITHEHDSTAHTKTFSIKKAERKAREVMELEETDVLKKLIFSIPIWKTKIKIENQDFELRYSGVTGAILKNQTIPEKPKTSQEIVRDSFNELKDPRTWVKMGKELVRETKKELGK